jgi:hypothetical protein
MKSKVVGLHNPVYIDSQCSKLTLVFTPDHIGRSLISLGNWYTEYIRAVINPSVAANINCISSIILARGTVSS